MRSIALADTSALLALASARDQYHDSAVGTAKRFLATGGRFIGTTLVLGEFHGLVVHRRGPGPARSILSGLLNDPAYDWVGVPPDLVRDATGAWLVQDRSFSLADAVSFEVMRRERITTAFAFDRDFVTAGFELLQ